MNRAHCGARVACPSLIVMLHRSGMTQTEIAEDVGCSQNAVSHALIKRGINGKRGQKGIDADIEDAIASMARSGVSYYAIERATGVSHATASAIAIRRGIRRGKGGGCAAKANAKRHESAVERIAEQIGERFEIVEDIKPNWFVLRCRECGHEFERFVDLNYQTTCPECRRKEIERHAEERELSSVRRALVRTLRKVLKVKEREERERAFLDAVHVCKECGCEFTMRELRESNPHNYTSNPSFCCAACRKRYNRRNGEHRRRERCEHGRGVSLAKLIARDDSICWICGGIVDEEDFTIDENGNFAAGRRYPSVDHVVPLSRGGKNDMSNAKLAHCFCNAIKSAGTVDEARRKLSERGCYYPLP